MKYTSKEFVDSDEEPTSQPPGSEDVNVETAPKPRKKKRKLSVEHVGSAAHQHGGDAKQEADIARLKDLLRAAGAKVPRKKLAELSASQAMQQLTAMLQDLGLHKPFTLAKARSLREERELVNEVEALGGRNNQQQDLVRGRRRAGRDAGQVIQGILTRQSGATEEDEELDERKEKIKDARAQRNVANFLASLQALAE